LISIQEGGTVTEDKLSILLVDRDSGRTETFAAKLAQPGFVVTPVHDGAEARSHLKSGAFDGLIIDVLMTRTGHLDIVSWTRYRQPSMVIVVTSDLQAPAVERELLERGANVVVTKLVAADTLAGYFAAGTDTLGQPASPLEAAEGRLNMIERLDMLMRSGRKMVLDVAAHGRRQGRIFVSEGQARHAVCGELLGEEALYRCLGSNDVQLLALPWREPVRVTIRTQRETLLLEAARRRDACSREPT
jgi:CheY-like chemotaxis protein